MDDVTVSATSFGRSTRIVIVGGGPAGYESALVAAQLGAQVTVDRPRRHRRRLRAHRLRPQQDADRDQRPGHGVPRRAARRRRHQRHRGRRRSRRGQRPHQAAGPAAVRRHRGPAAQGGRHPGRRPGPLRRRAAGRARTASRSVDDAGRVVETVEADVVLLATGGTPRTLPTAVPDGERILSWRDVYELKELPRAPGRHRLRGHRCRVRQRLLRARRAGDAGVQPRPGAARRGSRTPPTSSSRSSPAAAGRWPSGRGRRPSAARPTGWRSNWSTAGWWTGSHALMCVGSVPNVARARARARRRRPGRERLHRRRPRLAHVRAVHLRRRRLHRRAAARLGRRHAGPDRDVARARRSGRAAAAEDGGGQRLHPSRDRDRGRRLRGDRVRAGAGPAGDAAAGHQRPGEDAGPRRRLRQAVLPPGHRRGDRCGRRRAERRPS